MTRLPTTSRPRATPEQVRRAREMRADAREMRGAGFSIADIARRFGLSPAQVRRIVKDVRWDERRGGG